MPQPVQARQPKLPVGAGAEYQPNAPSAGELGLAANIRTPFVGSMLLNAQAERRMAIDANNAMAAQAAEQQARQFDESLKLEKLKAYLGTLGTPFGGEGARSVGEMDTGSGWDTGRIEGVEQTEKDKAAAAAYAQYASGLANVGSTGMDVAGAAKDTPLAGVPVGQRPDVSMNDADNKTSLTTAEIAAAASRYGADQGLAGAQARANADAMPRVTSTVPGGATGIGYQVQGTDVGRVQSTTDQLAGQTGRPTRAEDVAPAAQQSAWGPGLKAQALSKGYTVDEGTQVQFIDKDGQRVPAIVATRPDGSKVYVTGAPGG